MKNMELPQKQLKFLPKNNMRTKCLLFLNIEETYFDKIQFYYLRKYIEI